MSTPTRPLPSSAAAAFSTPTNRAVFAASAEAGPSRARPAGASPAYRSNKHSVYGIEDRIVIDPGSRVWKVGFSGEPDPRAVFWARDDLNAGGGEAWELDLEDLVGARGDRREADRLVGVRVVKKLRETYHKHLMTDPKARKIIVVENTYLPTAVKEQIARALFENLRAPSISFTPSSLLALAACGRVTGLVVDSGWLETSITPVFASRPLFHLSRSTPLAGRSLHRRLRALLRHHATYIAPPAALSDVCIRQTISPVPLSLLTDRFVERIITESCLVGEIVTDVPEGRNDIAGTNKAEGLERDIDDERLISSLKHRYAGSSQTTDVSFKVPCPPGSPRDLGFGTLIVPGWVRERATEILFEGDDDLEAEPLPAAILNCILKASLHYTLPKPPVTNRADPEIQLPIDLRHILISSLLIIGGTSSLPGFIPRLRISLLRLLFPPPTLEVAVDPSPLHSPLSRQAETRSWRSRHHQPFSPLYPLAARLAVLNDPSPLDGESPFESAAGKAPRWTPPLLPWVGGSLAGALKTSAPEMLREEYDALVSVNDTRAAEYSARLQEAEREMRALVGVDVEDLRPGMAVDGLEGRRKRGWREDGIVGDWTRNGIRV